MTEILKLKSPADFIGKQGNGVISFGSGQPDLPPPPEAFRGIDLKRDLRYGLIQGEVKLRESLAREYPGSTAENFVITNGASEALDLIFRGWSKGEKVLLPRPYYYSYLPIIELAGMVPVFTDLVDGRIGRRIDQNGTAILYFFLKIIEIDPAVNEIGKNRDHAR